VLSGTDSILYEMALTPAELQKAKTVSVTLHYQATPPYYLMQRFDSAVKGPLKDDTARLYYLGSHLNTDAKATDGAKYMQGWKLEIARVVRPAPL